MGKVKSTSAKGPIAKKTLSAIKKLYHRKVIDFSEIKEAKIWANHLEKTIISEKELAQYDPLHGIYIYCQNKMSVFMEQLLELPQLSKLTQAYEEAYDTYYPSAPPISPVTKSYFTCWGNFDLCIGIKKETFGTIILDICQSLSIDPGLLEIFKIMNNSRMGLYYHEGTSEKYVLLREFVTQKQIKALSVAGYQGQAGEIWFVRIMPEPFEIQRGYSIIFTTPYLIAEIRNGTYALPNKQQWEDFFERNLHKTGIKERVNAYEFLMKYGLERHYWNEYIFEGYLNHTFNFVALAGFPDIPLSRPHSRESEEAQEF